MDAAFLTAMLASAPFAVITADRELKITGWNPRAERVFGAPAAERVGTPLAAVIPDDRRALAVRLMTRALERGKSAEFDLRLRTGGGPARFLSLSVSPVRGPDGAAVGLALWARDISRRVELDREFHKAERMQALIKLAGGVAHHFNNLLGGMLTAVDFALASDSPGAIRKALQRAADAVHRASALTDSLLAFSEMDRRGFDWADLRQVVQEVVQRQQPLLARRGVDLQLMLEADLPAMRVDGRRFGRVLTNLLANAAEAIRDRGDIHVVVERVTDAKQDALRLSVADTGEGIAEENTDRLFEPFFTTKGLLGGGQGTNVGLGLAVVYGIVTEMGGTLAVNSRVGVGTRVEISLPMAVLVESPSPAPAAPPPPEPVHDEASSAFLPATAGGHEAPLDMSQSMETIEPVTFLMPRAEPPPPAPKVRSADPHLPKP